MAKGYYLMGWPSVFLFTLDIEYMVNNDNNLILIYFILFFINMMINGEFEFIYIHIHPYISSVRIFGTSLDYFLKQHLIE